MTSCSSELAQDVLSKNHESDRIPSGLEPCVRAFVGALSD